MAWKSFTIQPNRGTGQRRDSTIERPMRAFEPSSEYPSQRPEPRQSLGIDPTGHALESSPNIPSATDSSSTPGDEAPEYRGDAKAQPDRPKIKQRKSRPLSLLPFRNASESQLSTKSGHVGPDPQSEMPPPTIIKTSPTAMNLEQPTRRKMRDRIFGRSPSPLRKQINENTKSARPTTARSPEAFVRAYSHDSVLERSGRHLGFEQPGHLSPSRGLGGPPAYGDHSASSLAIPVSRLSESSRSDGSHGEHGVFAQTTTTHTISTTTTFFRLPRRKRDKGPLFPLPAKISHPESGMSSVTRSPQESNSGRTSMSPVRNSVQKSVRRPGVHDNGSSASIPSPAQSSLAFTNAPFGTPGPAVVRNDSSISYRSAGSTPSLQLVPPRLGQRGRSSTMGSLGITTEDELRESSTHIPGSGRTSTSTGRKSFGDIFSLSNRLRQNSEPQLRNGIGGQGTSGSMGSKSNSLQIPREPLYPERADEDTPASYIGKLEAAVPRGVMGAILCKRSDEFSKTCLRKYMRGFSYFGDSIDIAIRKMLMAVELPKETQQIDRLLQGFADRYCECNPGIFVSVDEAYFVAFSVLLLHSDTHNKNNKRKMQKQDYVRNTKDLVEVSDDILECLYDNVSYTPFIHFEDDIAVNSHRLAVPKPRKSLFKTPSSENLRGPVDPYTLILDNKLDILRPSLKEVMDTEDNYSCTGTTSKVDVVRQHDAFFNSGILQIVSARSRPDAFLTQATTSNPAGGQAGVVNIRAAKVGLLWRKDTKKKKTKSPWQEWGAILTSSQLYFFRDLAWVKKLIAQQEAHYRQSTERGPVVFKPPLDTFAPDAFLSMDDAVALLDSGYKKHKHAFLFIKHGGFEEVFLANDESDMSDWVAKLNYAATFRTAGIRMRGHLGLNDQRQSESRSREDSNATSSTVSTPTGPVHTHNHRSNPQLADEIAAYRRQLVEEKIHDAGERLAITQKELDNLLRNARHLQVLAPIQEKTREALILAAGRMSAKLKWTRVEMWRRKCHCDILKQDLQEEIKAVTAQHQAKPPLSVLTPQKTPQPDERLLNTTETRTSDAIPSPKSIKSAKSLGRGSRSLFDGNEHESLFLTPPTTPLRNFHRRSAASMEVSLPSPSSPMGHVDFVQPSTTRRGSEPLVHRMSVTSLDGRPSQAGDRSSTPGVSDNKTEAQILSEAALRRITDPPTERPHTDDPAHDQVGAMSPPKETTPKDRGSVRRSLQKTLRDPVHGPHLPHHHRSRMGRESGSSMATTDDGIKSAGSEHEGLERGTGSFILHGKKASVITFGAEWQNMSNEERLRSKKQAQDGVLKEDDLVVKEAEKYNVPGPSMTSRESDRINSSLTGDGAELADRESLGRIISAEIEQKRSTNNSLLDVSIPSARLGYNPQPQRLQA